MVLDGREVDVWNEVYCPALSADGDRYPYAVVARPLLPWLPWRRAVRRCSACGALLPDPDHIEVPPR